MKKLIKYLKFSVLISLFLLALYIVFYRLGWSFLENWDEAWVGEAVRNMLRRGEYFVLYWNGEIWLDKPPVYFWLSAFWVKIFGLSEFSLRFTSALSGLILIFWVTVYSFKNFGFFPSLLAFSTLCFNNIFIWRARSGNLDTLLALLVWMSYLLIQSRLKNKYVFLGLLLAGIYLTKASVVFLPLTALVGYEVFFVKEKISMRLGPYLRLLLPFFLIVGSWLLIGSLKVGWRFADYYLFHADQGVSRLSLANFKTDYFWYAYYSLQRRFFWIFLLGLLFLFKKIKSLRNFLLVCFSTFLLIFLSFSEKRNNWYLVPLMSFWSVVIALGTGWFLTFLGKWRMIKFLALFGLVSVFGYISYKTYRVNIRAIMGSQTTRSQALVAKEINKITKKDEVVIRLDHLYPTTIYYSDRKVLSSPESAITGIHFLAREDLNILIEKGEVRWISGDQKDVDKFIPPAGYVLQSLVKKEGEVLAKILKEDEI